MKKLSVSKHRLLTVDPRKLQTMIMGEHRIQPGEIMMISMNTFGKLLYGIFWIMI